MPSVDHREGARARHALEELLANLPAIAETLPPGFMHAAERFVELLLAANRRVNLTRVTAPAEVARLHLLDSLAALPEIDRMAPAEAIDLGSGGGLPALPLAMARPEMRWTMVDTVGKKAAILAEFVQALSLSNVTVIADRAETLGSGGAHRERYRLVTARACAALPVLAELALPLLAVGGSLLAWKGPLAETDGETRRGQAASAQLGGGQLKIVDPEVAALGGHRFVIVPKERPTEARFPRRPGEPGRRPLG
ncbi:MAG: 16S rRNA (guanine(527)-N(7))-methyltransferase RsmG [Chloroflexi bacterium]|nr:16S rRNA (guanine(527)-N(7))-methyltransferase RsmG [Chloroflexota bacterium]